MPKSNAAAIVLVERITDSILILRGHKVLLDANLAALYGVPTGVLVQALKRNHERFPGRFHVPAHGRRVGRFEITICDLKRGSRRAAIAPYAIH